MSLTAAKLKKSEDRSILDHLAHDSFVKDLTCPEIVRLWAMVAPLGYHERFCP